MALIAKAVKRITPADYALQTVQDALANPLDSVLSQPILDGNLFKAVPVTAATAFAVQHKLGRAYVGYVVTRVQGANQILVRETTNADSTKTVTLIPSSTGTVDLLVF